VLKQAGPPSKLTVSAQMEVLQQQQAVYDAWACWHQDIPNTRRKNGVIGEQFFTRGTHGLTCSAITDGNVFFSTIN
jgi:hypothetical protein